MATRKAYPGNYVFDSYFTIRFTIGILGILLPLLMAVGSLFLNHGGFLPSISDYDNTTFQVFFVGILFVLAIFLFAYKGSGTGNENLLTNLASLAALFTALFPCRQITETSNELTAFIRPTNTFLYGFIPNSFIVGDLHLAAAGVLFALFAWLSFFVFPSKQDINGLRGLRKHVFNRIAQQIIYRTLGAVIIACIVMILLVNALPGIAHVLWGNAPGIFWLETIALVAFGLSWIVKALSLYVDAEKWGLYREGRYHHEH